LIQNYAINYTVVATSKGFLGVLRTL